jgi:predicted transcriptional regulator
MEQVLSIVDRLAGNPNSKLDTTNLVDVITQLTEVVSVGYQKVAALEASTSLTAAETPAVKTAAEPAAVATVAKTVQAEAPVVAKTAPVARPAPVAATAPATSAPTAQPTKSAAKKTASATIKSAPAVAAPTIPAPVLTAPAAKATASKAAAPKAAAKSTAKASKNAPAPAPVPQGPMTPEEKDQATADSMIAEHGSARAAAAYIEKNRTRGRKTAWQKIIEQKADDELRSAARNHKKINAEGLASAIAAKPEGVSEAQAKKAYSLETTGYAFAHIDRKPVIDPEKALGAKITCLIDGVEKTMMSRYIDAQFAMSPEEYIAHFDLRPDYPMTADGYKGEKRRLAAVQGLGKGKRTTTAEEAAPAPVEEATPATVSNRRSRKRAA